MSNDKAERDAWHRGHAAGLRAGRREAADKLKQILAWGEDE